MDFRKRSSIARVGEAEKQRLEERIEQDWHEIDSKGLGMEFFLPGYSLYESQWIFTKGPLFI